ncbi:ABC transporter transmembrane domain-containing protein [Methylibium sp.]|uniref:ABC transporter transmembrane domain-containing protein n=1 Tax=Methylibium sp. TaxID=2067992 RepID=UPI00178D2FFC|nr:ABC transporter transmembrane domain-containing protein [Methylibium sp.]MBA3590562.1 ATP-binding cassette domain-containing protein [Methylibium sp.]
MSADSINPSTVLAGLWQAVWRYRRRTLAAILLLVLAKAAGVMVPLVLKAIVDRFSAAQSVGPEAAPGSVPLLLALPVFLLLGYALLRFAGTLFTELRDLVFARVTQRTVTAFAERTFAHLMSLSPRFHVQRNTGSLIRDVERGNAGIGFLLGAGLFTVVPTLVEFVAVLAVMAIGYSLWFTLVIMVTFFVYAGFTVAMTGKRALQQRKLNELDSHANGRMVDSLLNFETVKTHAREGYERTRYATVLGQWVDSSLANQRALSALHIGQSAIIAAGVAAVMLLAGEQTVQGRMTVGDLVLVNAYVIQICLPLNALGYVFRQGRDALVATEKLFALLEQKAEIEDRPTSQALQVRGGTVAFEHVDFSYEAGRQILWDLDLSIPAGQTVAVVGGSGSGKSTLARLLLRLYDVDGGRITVDGQDLRSITLATLREAMGVVPQDTVLFNDTIAHNIGYGRTNAGMAEIIAAAQAAQVHEFILSLPEAYETMVGERGLKLSGGEKQRVAIARAFLKNPPIMIFDEATSALDTRAERAIQSELDRIAEGRTTLIIAHRLSTIVNADEIVVLDKGRIVERGRHEALLERAGLYAQLWNLQRQQQQFERLERALARQPVNLAVLLAQTIDGLREQIEARQVRLVSEVDFENASVTGDPSTLAQAMRELCMWALAGTPPSGRIELKLERDGANARLSVTDGRHGLAAHAPAVPPPGATDLPMGAPPRGTETPLDPLELRSTIERQGGSFTIEAPSSTHGMRYVIELPLRAVVVPASLLHGGQPGEQIATVPHAQRPSRPLAGLRVFAIDDDADARAVIRHLLELEGAQVLSFISGTQALAWLEAQPRPQWPQLVVCDIALGQEDGHAVIRRVREIEAERGVPPGERVPAIALSGLARGDDRVRALQAGFQVHLAKPVNPDELIATIFTLARSGRNAAGQPILPAG